MVTSVTTRPDARKAVTSRISLAEHALIRTAYLAPHRSDAAGLRYAALNDLLLDTLSGLARARDQAEQELFELIAISHASVRNQVLLPLRRNIHNGRLPAVRLMAAGRELAMPAVACWLALRDRQQALETELADARPPALQASRRALAELCRDEHFRRATALTSSELLRAVQRTTELRGMLDRRGVKSEPTVLRHVLRATTKTVPLTWLAWVGWANWAQNAPVNPPAPVAPKMIAPYTQANLSGLAAVVAEVVAQLPPADRPLRIAPGSYRRADRWVFRRPGPVTAEVHVRREELVELPMTAALHAVLDGIAGMPPGRATAATVIDRIAPGSADRAAAALADYLDQLKQVGVLLDDDILDPQSDAVVEDAARWAAAVGRTELAGQLSQLAALTRDWAETSSDERPATLARLNGIWARLLPGRPLVVDRAAVSEDLISGRQQTLPRPSASADLQRLAPLFETFDWFSMLRRAQRQHFVDTYGMGGRCRSVAEYATGYNRLWQQPNLLGDSELQRDPVAAELSALRARLIAMIQQNPDTDEVVLSDNLIGAAQALPAGLTRRPASYSVFAQPLQDGGLCVNQLYGGWGRFSSRFLHGLPDTAADQIRHGIRQALGPQAWIAQVRPVQGFAANRHPLLFDEEIGERTGRGTLRIEDLEVAHDVADDQIRIYRRGHPRPLDVLYLGFLVPLALPQQLAPLVNDLGSGLVELGPLRPARTIQTRIGPLTILPRLRYRQTVLARRTWLLKPEQVSALRERLRDVSVPAERVLAELRAEIGLPRQVFIGGWTATETQAVDGEVLPDAGVFLARMGSLRSHYVDLADALHLHHLSRILARYADGARIEEALPEPSPDRSCAELVLETYRSASEG